MEMFVGMIFLRIQMVNYANFILHMLDYYLFIYYGTFYCIKTFYKLLWQMASTKSMLKAQCVRFNSGKNASCKQINIYIVTKYSITPMALLLQ